MSIIDAFDNQTEAILHPAHFTALIEGFPKVAVVMFGERFMNALRENHEVKLIDTMIACVPVPVYEIVYKNQKIAVYSSTLGGSASAGLMEEMIAKGCENFLFVGSCGVLDGEIAAKSLIVPTAAYRDEGTSYHYAPSGDYINIPTASRLGAILSDLKLPYVCGKTWTTDAIFRETRGNMEKRKREGCITVEMECASVMAVAQFRKIQAYQFFYAADSLDAVEWEARTLINLPQDASERFLAVALEIAARL